MDNTNFDKKIINVIRFVALANFIYFFIEFYFARSSTSVSLFADSIDFLEDAAINFVILLATSWTIASRKKLSHILAILIIIPSSFALFSIVQKIMTPQVPNALSMSYVGLGAFIVNAICALVLSKYRNHPEGIVKAAVLSSRNDLLANIGIIISGLLTLKWNSQIPDLIVGLGIFILNFDAAKEVWNSAK